MPVRMWMVQTTEIMNLPHDLCYVNLLCLLEALSLLLLVRLTGEKMPYR